MNPYKIPHDPEYSSAVAELKIYIEGTERILWFIIKRTTKRFITYNWKPLLAWTVTIVIVLFLCMLSYNLYVKSFYTRILIREKTSKIERSLIENPIPKENIIFMLALQQL